MNFNYHTMKLKAGTGNGVSKWWGTVLIAVTGNNRLYCLNSNKLATTFSRGIYQAFFFVSHKIRAAFGSLFASMYWSEPHTSKWNTKLKTKVTVEEKKNENKFWFRERKSGKVNFAKEGLIHHHFSKQFKLIKCLLWNWTKRFGSKWITHHYLVKVPFTRDDELPFYGVWNIRKCCLCFSSKFCFLRSFVT